MRADNTYRAAEAERLAVYRAEAEAERSAQLALELGVRTELR